MNAWTQTLLLIVVFGLLAGVLRWAFGNDRRAVPDYTGDDFGLLNEVALVPTEEAARILAKRLRTAGIKATAVRAPQPGAYRVMVFPADIPDAKLLLRDV
ncbi:SPOR domain-containing protein [Umezawaea sp. Da 62-37]|uniref:SPOR domain-containing protein n=1 Tax=Umezawaea sp. Da 62-37 TaxID=3075927 RepID=UPI0028F6CC35|nr:SPOR domain-containing protein [Umezawaea sp. Da 62-37]WNV90139.1 SPOR domain-containing protein [Umezawaea sp. Da 62-37]